MMKFRFPLVIVIAVLVGCNNSSQADKSAERTNGFSDKPVDVADSLLKLVLAGHDTGMAKMMKISRSIEKIQGQLDSMAKLSASKVDKSYQETLKKLQEDLKYAEFGMNEWMEHFVLDTLSDKPDLKIKYLEGEKAKVDKVTENILSSLSRMDSLFKSK